MPEKTSEPGRNGRAAGLRRALAWAGLAGVLGVGWLAGLPRLLTPPPSASSGAPPHLLVEEVDVVTTDWAGRVHRRLRADELRQAAPGAKSELVRPRLTVIPEEGPIWRFTAERGEVSPDREKVYLPGPVQARRGEPGPLEVDSRDVRVMLSSSYGKSDEPSTIRGPGFEARGAGMEIWLEEGRIELLEETRGTFDPG